MEKGADHLILVAYSSHSGGGRTGLISLVQALGDQSASVFIDARVQLDISWSKTITVYTVPPTVVGRWRAERQIKKLARPGSRILRLGSVPPLFARGIPVYVFFENRYLLPSVPLRSLPLKTQLRLRVERWLVQRLKNCVTSFIVQSQAMADSLQANLGPKVEVKVMPFHQTLNSIAVSIPLKHQPTYDFIYAATGDPHKNHLTLLNAWILLSTEGTRPSLCLTLDPAVYPNLVQMIERRAAQHQLNIINVGFVSSAVLSKLYAQSKALIFPSLVESFGRPLLEAHEFGLPVLAAELDYVRDVLDPVQTFDPSSERSITRAVKRFLNVAEVRAPVLTPAEFLERIL